MPRMRVPSSAFQPCPSFPGAPGPVPVVTRYDYGPTGFSAAHLGDGGTAPLVHSGRPGHRGAPAAGHGARFVYAYYEGIDKVAHAGGLGEYYDDELVAVDRLVADVLCALPAGATLLVTADHGQVDVGRAGEVLPGDVMDGVTLLSGEGRFRWLHVRPGACDAVVAAATDSYGDVAWVRTREQIVADGWLGGVPSAAVASRMGDVLLAPSRPRPSSTRRTPANSGSRPGMGHSPPPRCWFPCSAGPPPEAGRAGGRIGTWLTTRLRSPRRSARARRAAPRTRPTGQARRRRRARRSNEPAKVLRIGSMVKTLLEEVRQAPLDEKSRTRLREIYEQSIHDLSEGLSPDLVAELDRMALPFDDTAPSESELRIAQAQLVGWLEGLFHGIQATLMSQQMAARSQLEEMRQRGLPQAGESSTSRPGAYL